MYITSGATSKTWNHEISERGFESSFNPCAMIIPIPKNISAVYNQAGHAFLVIPKYKNRPPTNSIWNKCTITNFVIFII